MSAGTLTPSETRISGDYIEQVMSQVKAKNPAEPEFHQAVEEVFESLRLVLQRHPEYRDARILPIYEGTTAIQANDFVGRKLLRDGGAVARAQIEALKAGVPALRDVQGQHAPAFGLLADRLQTAGQAYASAVTFMLDHARADVRGVFTGSVPCLMLAGTLHAGWQLARAALVSAAAIETGSTDPFYPAKIATAVQYAAHVLPRTAALADAVEAGIVADRYAGAAGGHNR